MPERLPQREHAASPAANALLYTSILITTLAGEMQWVMAQGKGPERDAAAERVLPLTEHHARQLMEKLAHDDFAVRERAHAELQKHVHEHPVLLLLLQYMESAKEKETDAEQRLRVKALVEPAMEKATASTRFHKPLDPHPKIGYIPENAKLPPGLIKMIGKRDAFDTRLFFRKLPEINGINYDDAPLHQEFRNGTEMFTAYYERYALLHALTSKDFHQCMKEWAMELERIRAAWDREEKKEAERPVWP